MATYTWVMHIMGVNIHPDDMEISCGGTLARYAGEGNDVLVLNMTPGLRLGDGSTVRRREEEKACEILGAETIFLEHTVEEVWKFQELVPEAVKLLKDHDPDVVIMPKPDDP